MLPSCVFGEWARYSWRMPSCSSGGGLQNTQNTRAVSNVLISRPGLMREATSLPKHPLLSECGFLSWMGPRHKSSSCLLPTRFHLHTPSYLPSVLPLTSHHLPPLTYFLCPAAHVASSSCQISPFPLSLSTYSSSLLQSLLYDNISKFQNENHVIMQTIQQQVKSVRGFGSRWLCVRSHTQ